MTESDMTTTDVRSYVDARDALAKKTRFVPGFPAEGIVFEDLTPVLADGEAFALLVDALAAKVREWGADMVGGLDARGFLLGSAVAYKLGLGILAIRKKGKLPPPVYTKTYALEYGTAALELPSSGIELGGKKVALIDDVLATGGTLVAASELISELGGEVVGYGVVLEVEGLGARERLQQAPVFVVNVDS
ncbi:adenine phosphoribosyltransferase [Corynebacterium felinum]|uniref:Adenine phosphoribosyltransferase n=1 Tax=Corynebacterium felinum TaxID=131318 RepID=A0ABU2BB21_9CORY|nr:adenine phosphoribosyltransferase [Corynebacterium felinum]MDF5821910.1 adenine phosphoribosyltransferase [Corynebacterium felinum]MDR7355800.1 adenine phosphoribosyltransferase [Corynebacterium felinum]WJY95146.1 Adenine phosphoribosyltransferase [Corynebacterium felinum]